MDKETLFQKDQDTIMGVYARFPVALIKGKGARCWDTDGKGYLDFTSGIGVNSLGFCYDPWVKEVAQQASTLSHTSNLFFTQPQVEAGELLIEKTGAQKVLFVNSGTEANEAAIKAARKYGMDQKGKDAYEIIALQSAFHGRTMGALAATPQPAYQDPFGPMLSGFRFVEPGDMAALKEAIGPHTCAIMMELIQGESGVSNLPLDFVKAAAQLCKEENLLLIVDEVQTGNGRTGTYFAYEQFSISPDIVTTAKGLGGGLPIGAILFFDKVQNIFVPGNHGTTFGGNPIVCAGAKVVLSTMDEGFLEAVLQKALFLREGLTKLPHVEEVTGLGMMIGLRLSKELSARTVVEKSIEKGLLLLTAHDRVRLLPPLTISQEELEEGLSILNRVLEKL